MAETWKPPVPGKRGTEPFQALFGSGPRVKLVEALIRLQGRPFTRGQWSAEAGLHRTSTTRVMDDLVNVGLLHTASTGRVPKYRTTGPGGPVAELARARQALDLALSGFDVDSVRRGQKSRLGAKDHILHIGTPMAELEATSDPILLVAGLQAGKTTYVVKPK